MCKKPDPAISHVTVGRERATVTRVVAFGLILAGKINMLILYCVFEIVLKKDSCI